MKLSEHILKSGYLLKCHLPEKKIIRYTFITLYYLFTVSETTISRHGSHVTILKKGGSTMFEQYDDMLTLEDVTEILKIVMMETF